MKAIQIAEPKLLKMIDLPYPNAPAAGMALVRTDRLGICGTDYSGYLGKMPFFSYPRIPGHELGVEVLQVGPGVHNVRVGDRCSVEPYMNCGDCFACRRGQGNCCQSLKVIGVMVDGGLREQFLIRADKLHPSSSLSYEQLALVETLAIGCHACDRTAPQPQDQVLIIGAGPIGLACLEFVRLTGAQITVMDMVESRLEFCRQRYHLNATIRFSGQGDELRQALDITSGDKYVAVIDATGSPRSMSTAFDFVAHSGSLVYVGITTEEIAFKHAVLHKPEITLKGSRNAHPRDFTRIIRLIEEGTIDTDAWITHRTNFDQMIDQFDQFTRPESGVIKAIVSLD